MFPQIGSQTVIVFKHIQFIGEWKRTFPLYGTSYEALRRAQVVVVEEVSSGTDVTYWFSLKAADEVFISYGDSQVHIPALCTRSAPGNGTRCSDKG
jgi:hypothetical protein